MDQELEHYLEHSFEFKESYLVWLLDLQMVVMMFPKKGKKFGCIDGCPLGLSVGLLDSCKEVSVVDVAEGWN